MQLLAQKGEINPKLVAYAKQLPIMITAYEPVQLASHHTASPFGPSNFLDVLRYAIQRVIGACAQLKCKSTRS